MSSVPARFTVVVVGSGFGATMTAIPIAREFQRRGKGETVLMLERGTWWTTPLGTVQDREVETYKFLTDKKQPVQYWASADDFNGLIDLITRCLRRPKNEDGLYDLTVFGKRGLFGLTSNDGVSILRACGVGGGSLVYSNITMQPPDLIFDDPRWPAKTNWDKPTRDKYFELARDAIGYDVLYALDKREPGPNLAAIPLATAVNAGLHRIVSRSSGLPSPQWRNPATAPGLTQLDPSNYPDLRRPGDLLIDRGRIFQVLMSKLTADYGTVDLAISDTAVLDGTHRNYCERQGRCNVGCLPGARNTLNKQLMRAIHGTIKGDKPKLGDVLDLWPLSEVQLIRPHPQGGYEVEYLERQADSPSKTHSKKVHANRVIVAAGCVGTTELMLRCQKQGSLPNLSHRVGYGFSTNGDYLSFLTGTRYRMNLHRGPVTTSFAHFNTPQSGGNPDLARFHTIEDQGIPRAFATLVGGGVPFIQSLSRGRHRRKSIFTFLAILRYVWNRLIGYVPALLRNYSQRQHEFISPDEQTMNMMCCVAMGRDAGVGRFRLGESWRETGLRIRREDGIDFYQDPIYREIEKTLASFAGELSAEPPHSFRNPFLSSTAELASARSIALSHPLGGCIMGSSVDDGVVDEFGRVYDASKADERGSYKGLYIADAAAIPTALGVNPSLTIAALALRAADNIIEELKADDRSGRAGDPG